MQRRNTVILMLLLLLAGGALVNVAAAWGCALRSRMTIQTLPGYAMSTTGADTIVFDLTEFRHRSVEPGFIRQYDLFGWEWRGLGARKFRVSRWIGYNTIPEDTGDFLIERRSGWPLFSIQGECRDINDMHWAIPLPEGWGRKYNYRAWTATPTAGVFVPLKPILPGFLINTLFYAYAALLWLILVAPFTARRIIRRQRGLCEKCAYPIGV